MPDSLFVDLYAALWAKIFGLERYARKPSPGQMSLFGGEHDVKDEPRDTHGQWTAGAAAPKKTPESTKPDVVPSDNRATLRQDETETKPALEEPKMAFKPETQDRIKQMIEKGQGAFQVGSHCVVGFLKLGTKGYNRVVEARKAVPPKGKTPIGIMVKESLVRHPDSLSVSGGIWLRATDRDAPTQKHVFVVENENGQPDLDWLFREDGSLAKHLSGMGL